MLCCPGINIIQKKKNMAQVLRHFSTVFPQLVHLKLSLSEHYQLEGTDDVEWHLLLHRFSALQTLHVSQGLAGPLAVVLEDMPEGMFAESLPSLNLIYLENQPTSSVEKCVVARSTVTVFHTKAEYNKRLISMGSKMEKVPLA